MSHPNFQNRPRGGHPRASPDLARMFRTRARRADTYASIFIMKPTRNLKNSEYALSLSPRHASQAPPVTASAPPALMYHTTPAPTLVTKQHSARPAASPRRRSCESCSISALFRPALFHTPRGSSGSISFPRPRVRCKGGTCPPNLP